MMAARRRAPSQPKPGAQASAACAAGLGVLVGGCSLGQVVCLSPPGPAAITLIAAPDANDNHAVAAALVFIGSEPAARRIEPMKSEDFFANRIQLARDFGPDLDIRLWELAPGQSLRHVALNPSCGRVRTLMFARYAAPGDHRQAIGNNADLVVLLNAQDFEVGP